VVGLLVPKLEPSFAYMRRSWSGMPSQVSMASWVVGQFFQHLIHVSNYRVSRPPTSFTHVSTVVLAMRLADYCSTCNMFLLDFSFNSAWGNLTQGMCPFM
jgi:hypothetical protein